MDETLILQKLNTKTNWASEIFVIKLAMPIQYELRRLFYLMNIQAHRNAIPNALILGAFFNS